jgi:hypothetical protein
MPDAAGLFITFGSVLAVGVAAGTATWVQHLRHRAVELEVEEQERIEEPAHEGATEDWSPADELAAVARASAEPFVSLEDLVGSTFDGLMHAAEVLGFGRLDVSEQVLSQLPELLASGTEG